MPVRPIPAGYHTATPYLIVKNAAQAIEFYKRAFGAVEHLRLMGPGQRVGHAEIQIGDSRIMLADEFPEMGAVSAEALGGTPISILLYVSDVDAAAAQAVAAGAKAVKPVQNQFYGDRSGLFTDPYGFKWSLATHVEDVSQEEVQRRYDAMCKAPAET